MTKESEVVWKPEVKLVFITPDAEELIERAYRNCFQSECAKDVEKRREFIKRCIKLGHLSPIEFAEAVFEVVCSRVCTHQLVRHRIASYAQESQRRVRGKTIANFCSKVYIYSITWLQSF